ncbi:hypothetical protein NC652_031779 [Populus alba x Populus x berolinensis]|nr:hypothetical protein NC652_031779 [Populus alba x Populus x berolinensis]
MQRKEKEACVLLRYSRDKECLARTKHPIFFGNSQTPTRTKVQHAALGSSSDYAIESGTHLSY